MKGDKDGKGKGCFKYDWEVELENPEEFEYLNIFSEIQYDDGVVADAEAYFRQETIDSKALTGGVVEDLYTACNVPCFNTTSITYAQFELCWDYGGSDIDIDQDIKKFRVELAGLTFEFPGDSLGIVSSGYNCCGVGWDASSPDVFDFADCGTNTGI